METLTNQEFIYRQTPASQDGTGTITSIYGNTLKWNQLINDTGSTITTNGITFTKNADGSITLNGTATAQAQYNFARIDFINGHKYLINGIPSGATEDGYRAFLFQRNVTANRIFTPSIDDWFTPRIRVSEGVTVSNVVFRLNIFDLTEMFGAGNEPSTVDEFTSLFPLSYYAYNAGTLLSFNGTGLKTVGFNQWDEEWEVGAYNSADGSKADNVRDRIRNKNPIRIFPSVNYYKNKGLQVYYYDASMNFIGWNSLANQGIFTPPSNARYMNFNGLAGTGTTYNNDICINISDPSKNGTYEPYTSSTLSLPISTYFPTGMKSAGSVYDELTPRKAITRIGSIDLGSLTWSYNSARRNFYANISDLKPTDIRSVGNGICPLYTVVTFGSMYGDVAPDKSFAFWDSDGRIYIKDLAYTETPAFKQAMSGVYLFYELATPTEADISTSLDLTFPIDVGGTEQLLPINEEAPTTSPIICDIDYRGMIPVNATVDPTGSGTIEGLGDYRYHSIATLIAEPTDEIYRFLRWEDENQQTLSTNSEYSFQVGE